MHNNKQLSISKENQSIFHYSDNYSNTDDDLINSSIIITDIYQNQNKLYKEKSFKE